MKDWWHHLAEREKIFITVGAIISAFLLGYALIWSPISNIYQNAKQNVRAQQQLLQWMQHASKRIQQLRTAGFTHREQTNQALLVITEKSIATQSLTAYLKQVQQPQQNQVVFNFSQAPFDTLIQWLQTLWKQNNIIVKQITVKKTETTGLVDAAVTLEKN